MASPSGVASNDVKELFYIPTMPVFFNTPEPGAFNQRDFRTADEYVKFKMEENLEKKMKDENEYFVRVMRGEEPITPAVLPTINHEEDRYINYEGNTISSVWKNWWEWDIRCGKDYALCVPGIEIAAKLMNPDIARERAAQEKPLTWGTDAPDDLVLEHSKLVDQQKLAEGKEKKDGRKEERDERKRKYKSLQ